MGDAAADNTHRGTREGPLLWECLGDTTSDLSETMRITLWWGCLAKPGLPGNHIVIGYCRCVGVRGGPPVVVATEEVGLGRVGAARLRPRNKRSVIQRNLLGGFALRCGFLVEFV